MKVRTWWKCEGLEIAHGDARAAFKKLDGFASEKRCMSVLNK
ncbi:MAG: hypothetical protein ACYSWO_13355 [Planctomycetota bacterium]